jgi:hypothetical protein
MTDRQACELLRELAQVCEDRELTEALEAGAAALAAFVRIHKEIEHVS